MDEEQQDVCAICLDPYLHVGSSKHGRSSLLLACGHEYHAGCLLLSCRKHPVDEWKCPLCRDTIVRRGMLDFHGDKKSGTYTYASQWECLQAFLNKATNSLHSELSGDINETYKVSMESAWVNSWLVRAFRYLPSSFDSACVTICGRYRVQCLLDPSKEPFYTLLGRHIFSMLTSLAILVTCTWFVKWFCDISISWVCPIGMHVLAMVLPSSKQRSLEKATCFVKVSDIANYIHAISYGLIAIILLLQVNRTLKRHILHDWPLIAIQVNGGIIILAIVYAFILFAIRLFYHVRFGYDEIMSNQSL